VKYVGPESEVLQPYSSPIPYFPHPLDDHTLLTPNDRDLHFPTVEYPFETSVSGRKITGTVELPEDPDNIIHSIPRITANGFCASEHAYAPFRNAQARNGAIAITYGPGEQALLQLMRPKHLLWPTVMLGKALWQATKESSKILEKIGATEYTDLFDLVGHSRGCQTAVLTAIRKNAHYRSVTLCCPAGLDGHSVTDLASRVPTVINRDIPGCSSQIVYHGLKHALRYPLHTVCEAYSVASCDILDDVKELTLSGTAVAVLAARNDSFFDALEMARRSGDTVDLFAIIGERDADHLYPQKHPVRLSNALSLVLGGLFNRDAKINARVFSGFHRSYREAQLPAQTGDLPQLTPFVG
jgi:hypothetical protein